MFTDRLFAVGFCLFCFDKKINKLIHTESQKYKMTGFFSNCL